LLPPFRRFRLRAIFAMPLLLLIRAAIAIFDADIDVSSFHFSRDAIIAMPFFTSRHYADSAPRQPLLPFAFAITLAFSSHCHWLSLPLRRRFSFHCRFHYLLIIAFVTPVLS
jgi:hypothetical protein